ncbi:MAG: S41 family peptidase [Vicinamibacteria bacterium]
MRRPATALVLTLVASGALVGGLFGERAQYGVERYKRYLRRYTDVLRIVEKEYVTEVEPSRLVHSSIRGMLRTLDPHSNFLERRDYVSLQERQKGSYHGLGISVQMIDGNLTVVSPFEGTPAYRLGIRAEDIISKIEGEETRGMALNEAVKRLRGPKGSEVTISITRAGYDRPLDFTIVRDEIRLRSVPYAFNLEDGVGYVRIADFTETTDSELEESLQRLRQPGLTGLVLDLRDNPGGLLDQAVSVSNKFLKKGSLIVYTRGRTPGSDQDYIANRPSPHDDLPLVVLVSRGSASASEIVAGAIQDHDRGLIVGENTFGKGLVQSIYRISEGNGLALTTAKYFTPSGRSIQRDYSGSFDDYYLSARRQEPPPPQGELKHTDAGREVFGGGGIAPDIHVAYPQAPKPILALASHRAISTYSAYFASRDGRTPDLQGAGVPPEEIRTKRPEDVRLIDKSFEVDDEVLEDFFRFLEEEEIPFSKEELQEHRDRLALAIEGEIFSSIWGMETAQRLYVKKDPQVRRAIEALPDAAELLRDPKGYVARVAAQDEGGAY